MSNTATVTGYLLGDPGASLDGTEISTLALRLFVPRHIHSVLDGQDHISFDSLSVICTDRDKIKDVLSGKPPLKGNDIVTVTGRFRAQVINSRSTCPYCGAANIAESPFTFLALESLERRDSGLTREEAMQKLIDSYDVNNSVELPKRTRMVHKKIVCGQNAAGKRKGCGRTYETMERESALATL